MERIDKGVQALEVPRWRLPDGVNLPTIDAATEAKLVSDRVQHGVAYMRVLPDGRIEHVPFGQVLADALETAVPWIGKAD